MLSQQSIYDLEDILGDSMRLLNGVQLDIVKQLRDFTEEKCYQAFTKGEIEYLRLMKRGPLGDFRQSIEQLEQEMKARENQVSQSVIDKKIQMKEHKVERKSAIEPIIKKHRMKMLQQQMHGIRRQLTQLNSQIDKAAKNQQKAQKSEITLDESQALDNAKQFLKNLRQQKRERKQQLEKITKKLQAMKQQQEQQEKQRIQAMIQQKKKQILQKSLQKQSQRQATKQQLLQHQHNFTQRMKSMIIHRRSTSDQLMTNDQIKRTLLTRKQKLKLQPLQNWQLQQHSKRYEEMRQREDEKRKEKLRKMVEEQKQKSMVRNSTSYIPEPKQEEPNMVNRNMRNRVKEYEDVIRKHFVPKVDPLKKKQLENLIEQIEHSGRHAKKTVLNNGSVILEEIKPKDPKIYGLQYLEESKLLINRKRKNFSDEKANSVDETHRQRPNYLTELRSSNKRNSGFSRRSQKIQKTTDYDEKVRLVQQETESLLEEAARKEAILKHGKFLSAEQMLKYKQGLDEDYLKIIRLKLKLIK